MLGRAAAEVAATQASWSWTIRPLVCSCHKAVLCQAVPLSSVCWRQAAAEAAAAGAAERERQVAALCAQQERALDRRAELDELRARRCALPACLGDGTCMHGVQRAWF